MDWARLGRGLKSTIQKELTEARDELVKVGQEVAEVDWQQVGAGFVTAGRVTGELTALGTMSLVAAARSAWAEHGGSREPAAPGADAVASSLEQIHASPEEARAAIREMSTDDMKAGVMELMERWSADQGAAVAAQRLGELDAVLEAAGVVGQAHDRRARSVPRQKGRPEPADADVAKQFEALRGYVAEAKQLVGGERSDLQAITAKASDDAWRLGAKAVGRVREMVGAGESGAGVGAALTKIRDGVGVALDAVSPTWLKNSYDSAKESLAAATQQAETVLVGLDGVENDKGDRDALFARFEASLGTAANAIDADANAVSVGFIKETAGGAAGGRGKELVYLRETGQLALLDLDMGGTRLGIGATKRPFARSIYGSPSAIRNADVRSGGEVGALIFHVGTDAGTNVRSWHAALGIGFNASLPLVADQSAYSIRQHQLGIHELTDDQQARIENMLKETPNASKTWTAFVRKTVGCKVRNPSQPAAD